MKSNVAILLSTYNGERFLREQIDSVLSQTYKDIDIYVRDDGSTDKTVKILKSYGNKFHLLIGKNIGIVNSFKKLLEIKGYKYYAFCDQDDIWEKDKIEIAIDKLDNFFNNDIPILYSSTYDVYDEEMNYLHHGQIKKNFNYENLLFATVSPGMTMVFNECARKYMLESLNINSGLHDGWITKICACLGMVIYDENPTVRYRRHGNAVTINDFGFIDRLKWNLKNGYLIKHYKNINNQLNYLKKIYYSKLDNDKKKIIDLFTNKSILYQLKKIFYPKKIQDNVINEIILRLMFLFWVI